MKRIFFVGFSVFIFSFEGVFFTVNVIFSQSLSNGLLIKVDLKKLELYLIDSNKIIATYPVAGPKFGKYSYILVGRVRKIELNPTWYPTEKTRQDFARKGKYLPPSVPPGIQNPLGIAIIRIEWFNYKDPIAIHGTNDPKSIGKRISRGCIRMYNQDILKLISFIKNRKDVKVIIE